MNLSVTIRDLNMPDAVTVAVALVIALVVFLAVRPLWRRHIGTGHGQSAGNDPEKNGRDARR